MTRSVGRLYVVTAAPEAQPAMPYAWWSQLGRRNSVVTLQPVFASRQVSRSGKVAVAVAYDVVVTEQDRRLSSW
jgi:hypothetical protein